MDFKNGQQLLDLCQNKTISDVMIERECQMFDKQYKSVIKQMQVSLNVMKQATIIQKDIKTMGGLIGGESYALNKYSGKSACGSLMKKAVQYALNVLEVNASMGIIVAAPTAGSAGVLPAGVLAIAEEHDICDDDIIKALFNASAIGYVITLNATVSGAEGGCQAEIGSASAMTASAVCEMLGGTPQMCLSAAANALANMLGSVCDPVGGLVEAPCQKRNAMGVSNALICAEMALAGITHLVPFDEMVDVMYSVGCKIPNSLRETALGGMAVAPSACNACLK